jgi:hypothetical protein
VGIRACASIINALLPLMQVFFSSLQVKRLKEKFLKSDQLPDIANNH